MSAECRARIRRGRMMEQVRSSLILILILTGCERWLRWSGVLLCKGCRSRCGGIWPPTEPEPEPKPRANRGSTNTSLYPSTEPGKASSSKTDPLLCLL